MWQTERPLNQYGGECKKKNGSIQTHSIRDLMVINSINCYRVTLVVWLIPHLSMAGFITGAGWMSVIIANAVDLGSRRSPNVTSIWKKIINWEWYLCGHETDVPHVKFWIGANFLTEKMSIWLCSRVQTMTRLSFLRLERIWKITSLRFQSFKPSEPKRNKKCEQLL